MANVKRNNTVTRCIVVAGTLLAGLGIWSSVAGHYLLTQSVIAAPATITSASEIDPNFSNSDTFLTQPGNQTSPATGTQSAPVQTAPAPRFQTRGS